MRKHHGVVVAVADPGVRGVRLGNLVGVVRGGDARADVEFVGVIVVIRRKD
jgi:hypothetical protein